MFRSHTKIIGMFAVVTIIAVSLISGSVFADETTTFNVNVRESLVVSVTTPTTWASGDIDQFLRNKVNVSVTSNNAAGFTATMTTKTADTSLTNELKSTYTLPTLSSNTTRGNFPANYWGYSLDDIEAGSSTSTYSALVGAGSTPITLLSSNTATSGSKDFYFGAKGDTTLAAGTYSGTVVISVVSGVIDNSNPVTPVNPAGPSSTDNTAEYTPAPTGGSNGATAYTYRSTSGSGSSATDTVTTQVSEGNNVNSYIGYTPPQGETYRTTSYVASGPVLASGLAATASMAAASGIFLFIASKKREEEEDEEEDQISQM